MDNKTHLNLSIDSAVVQSCREKGLNLSTICEDSLRQILNSFEIHTLPEDCEHKWTWPFSVASGLAKECMHCGVFKKVVIEGDEPDTKDVWVNNLKNKDVEKRLAELKSQ